MFHITNRPRVGFESHWFLTVAGTQLAWLEKAKTWAGPISDREGPALFSAVASVCYGGSPDELDSYENPDGEGCAIYKFPHRNKWLVYYRGGEGSWDEYIEDEDEAWRRYKNLFNSIEFELEDALYF